MLKKYILNEEHFKTSHLRIFEKTIIDCFHFSQSHMHQFYVFYKEEESQVTISSPGIWMKLVNLNWTAVHLPMMALYSYLNLSVFILVEFVLLGCHLNKARKPI
jgi:hypothetical protein